MKRAQMAYTRASESNSDRPRNRFRRTYRRKVCKFCADSSLVIDYKEVRTLRYFVTERGKITPCRISGNCAKHQRMLSNAMKRARNMALLPFTTALVR
jgi:small subunit ribosomal protein S18